MEKYFNTKTREQIGKICGIFSIILNLILVLFKLIMGYLVNSVSIISDGLNNLSDIGSNIATVIGFSLSGKHPDDDHPYGHGRYEYLSGLIISFIILFVAFSALKESIIRLIHPVSVKYSTYALIALIVSDLIKLFMAKMNYDAYKITGSSSLKAASQDSINDVLTTTVTMIALLSSLVTDAPVDAVAGIIVSLIVVKAGIDIFKDTISPLVGQKPDESLVNQIYELVNQNEEVLDIHDFMLHDYGMENRYCTFHVSLDSTLSLLEAHHIVDRIERSILGRFNINTTIHYDPVNLYDNERIYLEKKVAYLIRVINENYSIHDFRIEDNRVYFDILIPVEDQIDHSRLIKVLENQIKLIHSDYECIIQIDHI